MIDILSNLFIIGMIVDFIGESLVIRLSALLGCISFILIIFVTDIYELYALMILNSIW